MSIQYRFVPIYDNLNEDSEKVTGFSLKFGKFCLTA